MLFFEVLGDAVHAMAKKQKAQFITGKPARRVLRDIYLTENISNPVPQLAIVRPHQTLCRAPWISVMVIPLNDPLLPQHSEARGEAAARQALPSSTRWALL